MELRIYRPFNITSGVDTNLDGNTNDRPNVSGNPKLQGGCSRGDKIQQFFNPDAITPAQPGIMEYPYGNAPRNILVGPGTAIQTSSRSRAFLSGVRTACSSAASSSTFSTT